jgi:hypothetical protein
MRHGARILTGESTGVGAGLAGAWLLYGALAVIVVTGTGYSSTALGFILVQGNLLVTTRHAKVEDQSTP